MKYVVLMSYLVVIHFQYHYTKIQLSFFDITIPHAEPGFGNSETRTGDHDSPQSVNFHVDPESSV